MHTIQQRLKKGDTIFGIDPGSRSCGFACIMARTATPYQPKDFQLIDMGVLELSPKQPFAIRIQQLRQAIHLLVESLSPSYAAMETAFLGVNPYSALKLGEIRGMCSGIFSASQIPLGEIAPNSVKKRITGHGHASKALVSEVLKQHFFEQIPDLPFDATDALAIALSYGLEVNFYKMSR